jgi:riboflavin synthase alpha subunit
METLEIPKAATNGTESESVRTVSVVRHYNLGRSIIPAVDGVSLTVNEAGDSSFVVNIIPHTRAITTFRGLAAGSRVNLEVDLLARYVERILKAPPAP